MAKVSDVRNAVMNILVIFVQNTENTLTDTATSRFSRISHCGEVLQVNFAFNYHQNTAISFERV